MIKLKLPSYTFFHPYFFFLPPLFLLHPLKWQMLQVRGEGAPWIIYIIREETPIFAPQRLSF